MFFTDRDQLVSLGNDAGRAGSNLMIQAAYFDIVTDFRHIYNMNIIKIKGCYSIIIFEASINIEEQKTQKKYSLPPKVV